MCFFGFGIFFLFYICGFMEDFLRLIIREGDYLGVVYRFFSKICLCSLEVDFCYMIVLFMGVFEG